jgi:hypothetical protein
VAWPGHGVTLIAYYGENKVQVQADVHSALAADPRKPIFNLGASGI